MARKMFGIENGLSIYAENADNVGTQLFVGTGVPGGDGGDQDAAPLSSLYFRIGTPQVYKKIATSNNASDWELLTSSNILTGFRNELVRAVTATVAPATGSTINLTSTPFIDDNAPLLTATDFSVNDHIIYGYNGTVKLMRVSVVSAPNITVVDALYPITDGDSYVCKYYLSDSPDDQEKSALVYYNGTVLNKLGDFNWNLADGIGLNSFSETQGPVTSADTVQTAIQKVAGDASDLVSLSGVARGATNLGTFTGDTIADSQTNKQALQSLETALEARSQLTNVTSVQTLDSVLVDKVKVSKWIVQAFEQATPTNIQSLEISALHNGTAAADATLSDNSIINKLKLGTAFNLVVSVDLNGTGAAQTMRLRVQSSTAGVTVTARRIEVY